MVAYPDLKQVKRRPPSVAKTATVSLVPGIKAKREKHDMDGLRLQLILVIQQATIQTEARAIQGGLQHLHDEARQFDERDQMLQHRLCTLRLFFLAGCTVTRSAHTTS